jgi:hypothetical protein
MAECWNCHKPFVAEYWILDWSNRYCKECRDNWHTIDFKRIEREHIEGIERTRREEAMQ